MTHKLKAPTYINRSEPSRPASDPVFAGQHEGEEVLLVFRQHPVVMRKSLLFGLVIILLAMAPLMVWQSTSLVSNQTVGDLAMKLFEIAIPLVLVFWVYTWVKWYYSVNILTSERIYQIKQQGLFKREIDSLFHARIHAVNYNVDGLQGHLFGFGTLHLLTEVGNFDIPQVPHPAELHEKIVESVRDHIGEDE